MIELLDDPLSSARPAIDPNPAPTAPPDPTRRLTWLYACALAIIGFLAVLSQLLVQPVLKTERDRIPVINLAGTQRMMSQKITKAALALQPAVDNGELRKRAEELRAVLTVWTEAHEALQHDGANVALRPHNTPEIVRAFADLDPHFRAMHTTTQRLVALADGATVETLDRARLQTWGADLMEHEGPFLEIMDHIVSLYDREAREALARLQRLGMLLTAAMLTVLALTAFFVFRPATATIGRQMRQLRESEERFRATFDQAAVGMAHVAPDSRWLYLNRRFCDIVGYTCEELLHKTFADITHPDDLKMDLQQVRGLLAGEIQSYSLEKRYIHKNGWPVWANISVSLLRDASGDPKYFIAVVEDITTRRQAEAETRNRVRQQAVVAELGQRALAGADPQALMDDACSLLARTLGLELCKVLELLPSGDALLLRSGIGWKEGLVGHVTVDAGVRSQAGYTLLSNQPVIVEDHTTETRFSGPSLLRDHGVMSGMSVVVPGRNRPFGVLGVHTTRRRHFSRDDIHFLQAVAHVLAAAIERKRAETEITSWKDRYETAVAASGLVLYDWDTESGHITFGGSYRRALGYSEEELAGGITRWLELVHPQDRDAVVNEAARAKATHGRTEIEYRVRRRDGDYIFVRMIGHFYPDATSARKRMIGFISDITQRKLVERMKNEFVSTVSHELRTPLTSITGSLGLINGGVAGELPLQAKGLIEIAYRNSERLGRLINDILDIDKIESGKIDFALQPVDLMQAVDEALTTNRAFAVQFKVRLALEQGLPGMKVCADPDRLMQVFTNLLSNAAKFSPQGETVTVRVARDQGVVRVAITDRGPGIPDEFKDRVFQKFAQADTSDSRAKSGTGLGLSIAKAIVEKFGGDIGFESAHGKGTTFYVDLPEWKGPFLHDAPNGPPDHPV
jgi:PAS domain S-box-containing protein